MQLHIAQFESWSRILRYVAKHPDLQEHYAIGVTGAGYVVFAHRDHIFTHVQGVAATQCGKTIRLAAEIITQEMIRGLTSIIYIDPKGDGPVSGYLFKTAEEAGLPTRYITLESDRASYAYFPLRQHQWVTGADTDRFEMLMKMFALDSGEFKPDEAYFQGQCGNLCLGMVRAVPNARSFRDFEQFLQNPRAHKLLGMTRNNFENAGAAMAQLARCASIPQINGGSPSPYPSDLFWP